MKLNVLEVHTTNKSCDKCGVHAENISNRDNVNTPEVVLKVNCWFRKISPA